MAVRDVIIHGVGDTPKWAPKFVAGASANGNHFVDQFGDPILFVGEDLWCLAANAGAWGNYQTALDTYFTQRSAQGYNLVETSLFSANFNNNAYVNATGQDWDGTWPFTTTSNPSSGLNSTFWARRDYMFSSAAAHGFTVCVSITGPNLEGASTNICRAWTNTQWSDLGTALGTRYASTPNIVWIVGDDYFDTYNTQLSALRTALRAAGDTHLLTIQYNQESTSRSAISDGSLKAWRANADYNWVYTYNPSYAGIDRAFAEVPSAGSAIPAAWCDGNFLATGGLTGFVAPADYSLERRMIWWALSEGARGFATGDNEVYPWDSTSAGLVTSKTFYSGQVPAIVSTVKALPGWWLLQPDTTSVLVTAGRGTKYTGAAPYVSNTDTWVTASRVSDGSLALIYMSSPTTITIDQTKMVSGYTATWVDPASGATSSATPGTTYNSTAKGNNSAGDTDWALILKGP